MSRFSQFAASTPIGKVDQFLAGTVPNGYLQLNGQCICKNTNPTLYTVVGDLEPPITDSITLCALSVCGTCVGGYCFCRVTGALSSWGPTCITKFTMNEGCSVSESSKGVFKLCYVTSDLTCGVLPDLCNCCGAGWSLCIGSNTNIFSFHQSGSYYVGASISHCNSSSSRVALWNFTCKCLVTVYQGPGTDMTPICPADYSRVVYRCNGPFQRKWAWLCAPAVVCHCCSMGFVDQFACICNAINGSYNQFYSSGYSGPNQGASIRYTKHHCGGKEPYLFIAVGTSGFQNNYNSNFCCATASWRFDTFQGKIDQGCCWFNQFCQCPTAWGLPYNWQFQNRIICFGSGVACNEMYATIAPQWSYGCGPGYACCRWYNVSYVTSSTLCMAFQTSGFPTVSINSMSIPANIITPSTGPVQTGGSPCLSGLAHFYYNEKSCKWWGKSCKLDCVYCCPSVNNSSVGWTAYDFCYCTGQAPISHGSSTYCSPLACTDDPQKYTANTVPFNPGSCTCNAVLYGVSSLGPSSPLFMLPNISSPVTGLAYYIKS